MKMKRTAVITTLSVLVGLGIVGVSPAFAGDWGKTFNEWNSIQGSLSELNEGEAKYGTDYYNDTLDTRNHLNNQASELYNSTRPWNN
jgi:hypothetical protein